MKQQAPGQLSLSVVVGQWHGRHLDSDHTLFISESCLSVFVVVLALQMECVLLDFRVTEGLQDT